MTSELIPNKFYIYEGKNLIAWDIYEPAPANRGFVRYFSQVLRVVDHYFPNSGMTFYITMHEMEELPSYGSNVIVLLLGDEFYRVPKYRHKVGAIFKCYGTHQIREQVRHLANLKNLASHPVLTTLILLQALKNLVRRFKYKLYNRLQMLKLWLRRSVKEIGNLQRWAANQMTPALDHASDWLTPIYDIPPGYSNSENLPIKPVRERAIDVFFDGSIVHTRYPFWSIRYWSKTPKTFAREQMASNLLKFKQQNPRYNVQISVLDSFSAADSSSQDSYSYNMMNAKICLVPRGTTPETYRLFEAMRYGCVIVGDRLPDRWFYAGAPAIQLSDWNDLEATLEALLADPQRLEQLHQQTLKWWETKCSEMAIGTYLSEQLQTAKSTSEVLLPEASLALS